VLQRSTNTLSQTVCAQSKIVPFWLFVNERLGAAMVDNEYRKDWTSVTFDGNALLNRSCYASCCAEARAVLRDWRDSNVRRSEEAVELWEHVLSRHPAALDDEVWVVYEQVCPHRPMPMHQ
jgi:hypothetical protein